MSSVGSTLQMVRCLLEQEAEVDKDRGALIPLASSQVYQAGVLGECDDMMCWEDVIIWCVGEGVVRAHHVSDVGSLYVEWVCCAWWVLDECPSCGEGVCV